MQMNRRDHFTIDLRSARCNWIENSRAFCTIDLRDARGREKSCQDRRRKTLFFQRFYRNTFTAHPRGSNFWPTQPVYVLTPDP
jgi:hypothetical protein